MSALRILLVSEDIPYPSMGGLAKHVLNLARALVRAGHQVDLLGGAQHPIEVCGEEGRFGGRFFGELKGQHAGWKEVSLGVFMPFKRPAVARRFARIIMRHAPGYDVIHYHGHIANVGRYIPSTVNFVQTRHDQGSDCFRHTRFRNGDICMSADPADCAGCAAEQPNGLQRLLSTLAVTQYRREVAQSFRRHKTIFVSDMLQRNVCRTLGAGPWGTTIHHFIDADTLKEARARAGEKTARSAGPPFHVFIAGKLYAAKGVAAFLHEFARRNMPDMRLTIAGEGPDEARLRSEFADSRIRFLGWCTPERTLLHMAEADAVVVPSLWEEPFGSTTLEGLLLGKPTFALDRGGTPELAVYASAPGQLRLHPDMRALVDDLASFDPKTTYDLAPEGLGSADRAVPQVLSIYRLPPGHKAAASVAPARAGLATFLDKEQNASAQTPTKGLRGNRS